MTPLSGLSEDGNLTLSLELEGPLSTQEDISLDIEFNIGVSAGIALQLGSTRSGKGLSFTPSPIVWKPASLARLIGLSLMCQLHFAFQIHSMS